MIQGRRHAADAHVDELIKEEALHAFIDVLQRDIGDIHGANAETWFLASPAQVQTQAA